MLGSATITIVTSSRSMNVVVQTATSVHRRSLAPAASIGPILGKPPPQRRNGPRAVSYEGDGEVGRDVYRPPAGRLAPPFEGISLPTLGAMATVTPTLVRLDRGY